MTDKIPLLEGTTPGPWGFESTDKTIWLGIIKTNANGSKVDVVVADFDCGPDYSEAFNARQLANARLIAAAPDLARKAASAEVFASVLAELAAMGFTPGRSGTSISAYNAICLRARQALNEWSQPDGR